MTVFRQDFHKGFVLDRNERLEDMIGKETLTISIVAHLRAGRKTNINRDRGPLKVDAADSVPSTLFRTRKAARLRTVRSRAVSRFI
jgi:hypothetical protein